MPFIVPAAAADATAFTSLTVTGREASKVRSTQETFGVGTRIAEPSSLPAISGNTSPKVLAAPVEVGIKAMAAALARYRSL